MGGLVLLDPSRGGGAALWVSSAGLQRIFPGALSIFLGWMLVGRLFVWFFKELGGWVWVLEECGGMCPALGSPSLWSASAPPLRIPRFPKELLCLCYLLPSFRFVLFRFLIPSPQSFSFFSASSYLLCRCCLHHKQRQSHGSQFLPLHF